MYFTVEILNEIPGGKDGSRGSGMGALIGWLICLSDRDRDGKPRRGAIFSSPHVCRSTLSTDNQYFCKKVVRTVREIAKCQPTAASLNGATLQRQGSGQHGGTKHTKEGGGGALWPSLHTVQMQQAVGAALETIKSQSPPATLC